MHRVGGDPHAKHLGHRLNGQGRDKDSSVTFKNSRIVRRNRLESMRIIITREKLLIDRKTFQYAPSLETFHLYILLDSFPLSRIFFLFLETKIRIKNEYLTTNNCFSKYLSSKNFHCNFFFFYFTIKINLTFKFQHTSKYDF